MSDKDKEYEHNKDLARVLMVINSDTLNTALLCLRQYKTQICKEQREICAKEVEDDSEVEQVIIDCIRDNIRNAPEPK